MCFDKLHFFHSYSAKNVELSELIVECQKLMREYAYEQLRRFGLKDSEAKPCAASCVSQRDIQVWTLDSSTVVLVL